MERKIGETFEYQGKTYKVAEFDACRNCAFGNINCTSLRSITGNCMYFLRNDGVNVKFEEIKNDMEIKDNKLTINIPYGMEIDIQNSNFDAGVIKFKKKELTYEDIKASLRLNENMTGIDVADENVNRLYAINRLMCIAKFYNGDWKPDWSSVENKYYIIYCNRSQCYTTDYKTLIDVNTVYFKCEKYEHKHYTF